MGKVFELKVFKNGGSNAVRIPASIQLSGDKLFLVVEDDGRMRLERDQPQPMAGFFALLDAKAADGSLAAVQSEAFERESQTDGERDWQKWDAASNGTGDAK